MATDVRAWHRQPRASGQRAFHTSTPARWLVRAGLAAVLTFAVVKLFVLTQPLPGTLKQNLSVDRVINFLAIHG